MDENKMFEYAVRYKLRFPYKGLISVEDLWDLNVEELDKIYKTLNRQKKSSEEESLLIHNHEDEPLKICIDIIKYIVYVKEKEKEEKTMQLENNRKKKMILDILEKKQNDDLANKSIEELKDMLENL